MFHPIAKEVRELGYDKDYEGLLPEDFANLTEEELQLLGGDEGAGAAEGAQEEGGGNGAVHDGAFRFVPSWLVEHEELQDGTCQQYIRLSLFRQGTPGGREYYKVGRGRRE